jgi:hypothetical protein
VSRYAIRRLLVANTLTGLLASCGSGNPGASGGPPFTADIRAIRDAIASGAHYTANAVQLKSSPGRLRIAVSDARLATADKASRNGAAVAIVGVAEQVLPDHPEYAKLEAISVAIIHPSAEGAAGSEWHVEDVVEFRKGPNQRFSVHVT